MRPSPQSAGGNPLILAIESATPRGSVALIAGDAVAGEILLPEGRQASETILSAVAELLAGSRPTHVAVSAGPGSFTGLRVGMAAAKGFCVGWGTPLVPVPTLHALAARFPVPGAAICPVLDARKREVYAGVFRREGNECIRLVADQAVAPGALPALVPAGPVFLCGDGIIPYGSLFQEILGGRARFAPEGEGFPRAAAVGLLAARLVREGKTADPRAAVPAYLRPSEAELKRPR